jgi:hypothetical protein
MSDLRLVYVWSTCGITAPKSTPGLRGEWARKKANPEGLALIRMEPAWLLGSRVWCPGPESNRHALRRGILSPLRLPISPPGRVCEESDYCTFPDLDSRFSHQAGAKVQSLFC